MARNFRHLSAKLSADPDNFQALTSSIRALEHLQILNSSNQQRRERGKARERKRRKEEKTRKGKVLCCFGCHRAKHVQKVKKDTTAGFHSRRTVGKQNLTNPLGRIAPSVRAVLFNSPCFNFAFLDLFRGTSNGIQPYTQSS